MRGSRPSGGLVILAHGGIHACISVLGASGFLVEVAPFRV